MEYDSETISQLDEFKRVLSSMLRLIPTIILFLIVFEIALRLFAPQYQIIAQPNDILGFRFIPNTNYYFVSFEGCDDWQSSGRINSMGIRGEEIVTPKPDDLYRIVLFGNSHISALYLPLDELVSTQLEAELNQSNSDIQYEVVNLGLPGTTPGVHFLYFNQYIQALEPDLVVEFVFPIDYEIGPSNEKPYFELIDGVATLNDNFASSRRFQIEKLIHPFRKSSFLVEFVVQMRYIYILTQGHRPTHTTDSEPQLEQPFSFTQEQEEAVIITEQILSNFNRVVNDTGAEFLLVQGSTNAQLANDSHDRQDPTSFDDATRQALMDFASDEGIPYIDLIPSLREFSQTHDVDVHGCEQNSGTGHWNQDAQQVASQQIADYVLTQTAKQ